MLGGDCGERSGSALSPRWLKEAAVDTGEGQWLLGDHELRSAAGNDGAGDAGSVDTGEWQGLPGAQELRSAAGSEGAGDAISPLCINSNVSGGSECACDTGSNSQNVGV